MRTVTLKVDAHDVSEMLRRIAGRIDLSGRGKLGEQIAQLMRDDVLRQFQAGGIPAWKPLAPSTVEQKRRMGYPRLTRMGTVPTRLIQNGRFGPENILIRTAALISSWTDRTDPHHFETVSNEAVSIGTDIPYAGVHQTGAMIARAGRVISIPKREVTITPQGRRNIAALVQSHLGGSI